MNIYNHIFLFRPSTGLSFNTTKENRPADNIGEASKIPKISLSSPTPVASRASPSDSDIWVGDTTAKDLLRRNYNGRDNAMKKKSRYPLIIERLTGDAKRIHRSRNEPRKNERSSNLDVNQIPPTPMDTLRVPWPNLTRKSITPKVHRAIGKNNKPYYMLKDTALNNVLYRGQQTISSYKPIVIKETASQKTTKSNNNASIHLTQQLEKLSDVALSNFQLDRNKIHNTIQKSNPLRRTKVGWK